MSLRSDSTGDYDSHATDCIHEESLLDFFLVQGFLPVALKARWHTRPNIKYRATSNPLHNDCNTQRQVTEIIRLEIW